MQIEFTETYKTVVELETVCLWCLGVTMGLNMRVHD